MVIYQIMQKSTGLKYVGRTKDFSKRIEKHLSSLNVKTKKHYPLYVAIKENGINDFEWNILEECNTIEESYILEQKWINALNTITPFGFNLSSGGYGNKGFKHSEESKRKISQNNYWLGREGVNKGKKFTEEHRKNISIAHKGKPNHIIYTDELRNLLSEQKKGIKNPMFGKQTANIRKVVNVETQEIFNSIKEAALAYKCYQANIIAVCTNRRKSCAGHKWIYYDDYMQIPSEARKGTCNDYPEKE